MARIRLALFLKTSFQHNVHKVVIGSVFSVLMIACSSHRDEPYSGSKTYVPGLKRFSAPYTVWGKTYYPQDYYEYDQEEVASWYGPGFHGRPTAVGEKFNQNDYTAAHLTLPLPSIAEVTNVRTGKTVTVVINDRGPFIHGRGIDLSRGAAEAIGAKQAGLAKVRVRTLPQESWQLCKWLLDHGKNGKVTDGRSLQEVSYELRGGGKGSSDLILVDRSASTAVVDVPHVSEQHVKSLTNLVQKVSATPSKQPLLQQAVLKKEDPLYIMAGTFANKDSGKIALLKRVGKVHLTKLPGGFGNHSTLYQAKLGPYPSHQAAKQTFTKLSRYGFKPMIVR